MRLHPCIALLALGLASCSTEERRPVVSLSGKVLLDGQPAEGLVLTFVPTKMPPDGKSLEMIKARVEADGSYKPITYTRPSYTPRPGIPLDEYVVLAESDDEGKKPLLKYYSDVKTTPLRTTITGPTELPTFELTTKPR